MKDSEFQEKVDRLQAKLHAVRAEHDGLALVEFCLMTLNRAFLRCQIPNEVHRKGVAQACAALQGGGRGCTN